MKKNSKSNKNPSKVQSAEKPPSLFDRLVLNGIDFFQTGVAGLTEDPKYSVINFCSGLEIILKARLLKEHWSLIVKKPENAIFEKFKEGNFISTNIEETLQRLENIAGIAFSKNELNCFNSVREHRNKFVHFYHYSDSKAEKKKLLQNIAAEQCKAWFYLYRRLQEWFEIFEKHRKGFETVNSQFHQLRKFLSAKFEALKPEIDKEKKSGTIYVDCSSCGFSSAKLDEREEPVFASHCKVCERGETRIPVTCPKCGKRAYIEDIGAAYCDDEECSTQITLDDVMKPYRSSRHTGDGDPSVYYCSFCENPTDSVIFLDEHYFCFSCKEWGYVEQCRYCGTHLMNFDSEDSYMSGCFLCTEAAWEHFDRM